MKRKLLTALLCSSLLLSGTAIPVIAQEAGTELQSEATIVHSGKIGTADWTIDSNGVLTIGEGEFTNNFYEYTFPWARYPNDIKRVDGTARFKLKGRAHSIFDSESITSIDLSGWDTSAVTDMSYMFCNCKTLTKLNLSGFNTSSVTKMRGMFYGCNALSELNLSSWDTSAVMDMSYMFISCKALSKLNLSGFNTSSVTDMSCMFSNCEALTELNLSGFNTSSVTDMFGMFSNCEALTELNLSGFDTSSVTDMRDMFHGCSALTELNLSGFDTSSVTDMNDMFCMCEALTELNLSGFDTSSVTDMSDMFHGCSALTELNLSGFDTSSVTDMSGMFDYCTGLKKLNLSCFDTSSVKNMSDMFWICEGLTELNISRFDTSSVTDMRNMFWGCKGLTELNVSGFDTSSVTDMSNMFMDCQRLTELNVSGFDTSSVTDMTEMFSGATTLSQIYYSQKAATILTQLPKQTGWYQNQQGPYDISNLPELAEGQIALLARDPSVTPNPGGDDLDPDNNYELTSSVNNNDPAIVRRGHSLIIELRLNKDGTLDNTFNMSHRKDSDILVSVNNSESLEISSCSFADDGSPVFLVELLGLRPGRAVVSFRDTVTNRWTSKEIWISKNNDFDILTEDSFQNVCIGFLRHDENYPASLLVSQKDPKFETMVSGFLSNVVFRGVEGWEEQFLQMGSTKAAQEMLLGFISESNSTVEKITNTNKTLSYGEDLIEGLTSFTGAEMLKHMDDTEMLSAISSKIKTSKSSSSFMSLLLEGDYDSIADYFCSGTNISVGQMSDFFERFYSSTEYLGLVGSAMEKLGYAGDIASATSATLANLANLNALKNANECYIECLDYLAQNCDFPQVKNAAQNLKNTLNDNLSATMMVLYDALETGANLGIDKIIDEGCKKLPPSVQLYKAAADFGITLGNGLFAIDEAQEAYDKLRVAAYMNKTLGDWIEQKNNDFKDAYENGTREETERCEDYLMGSLSIVASARENGEKVLQNYLTAYRFFGFPNPMKNNELLQVSASVVTTLQGHVRFYDLNNKGTSYITVCAACPIDLSVLSTSGASVLTLPNGQILNGEQSGIYFSATENLLTGDSLKTITLPEEEGLSIKLNASALGAVDYSVLSIDEDGYLQRRSLSNIPVNPGDILSTDQISFASSLIKTNASDNSQTRLLPIIRSGHNEIEVTSIEINPSSVMIQQGQKMRIIPIVTPSDAAASDVYWTSEDERIVTISDEGVITAVGLGSTTVTAHTLNGISKKISVEVTQKSTPGNPDDSQKPSTATPVSMHRLYNPNSGEHFYTAADNEKNHLVSVGWKYEGEGWKAPEKSNAPVYRLYNPNAGDHHYTLNVNEKDALVKLGWNYEGIGWYSDEKQAVPLYREYNPNAKAGSHNYTPNKKEHDHLTSIGWKDEGIAWYGLK